MMVCGAMAVGVLFCGKASFEIQRSRRLQTAPGEVWGRAWAGQGAERTGEGWRGERCGRWPRAPGRCPGRNWALGSVVSASDLLKPWVGASLMLTCVHRLLPAPVGQDLLQVSCPDVLRSHLGVVALRASAPRKVTKWSFLCPPAYRCIELRL